jgi:hypothetical protein
MLKDLIKRLKKAVKLKKIIIMKITMKKKKRKKANYL